MIRLGFVGVALLATFACTSPEDPGELQPLEYPDAAVQGDDPPEPDTGQIDDVDPDPVFCSPGFRVEGDDCLLEGDARWDVRVLNGTFTPNQPNGSDWDLNDSPPDGYVWIEFGPEEAEVETDVDSEKLEPEWNKSVLWAVTTDELRTLFDLRLYDYDKYDVIDGDDLMAGCLMPFPDEVFEAQQFDANDVDSSCPNVRISLQFAD